MGTFWIKDIWAIFGHPNVLVINQLYSHTLQIKLAGKLNPILTSCLM